jgi:hypothetical protein
MWVTLMRPRFLVSRDNCSNLGPRRPITRQIGEPLSPRRICPLAATGSEERWIVSPRQACNLRQTGTFRGGCPPNVHAFPLLPFPVLFDPAPYRHPAEGPEIGSMPMAIIASQIL